MLDVVIGTSQGNDNRLYRASGGPSIAFTHVTPVSGCSICSSNTDEVIAVAFGDFDGDGQAPSGRSQSISSQQHRLCLEQPWWRRSASAPRSMLCNSNH